jgi:hypothetical protein
MFVMADDTEARFLTLRNTGTFDCNEAIYIPHNTSVRLTQVTAESTRAGGSYHHGMVNNGSVTMTDVTVTASGGIVSNYGVGTGSASSVTIMRSKLSGSTNSLSQDGGTAKVAFTQLKGSIRKVSGILRCFDNLDANLAAVICP